MFGRLNDDWTQNGLLELIAYFLIASSKHEGIHCYWKPTIQILCYSCTHFAYFICVNIMSIYTNGPIHIDLLLSGNQTEE